MNKYKRYLRAQMVGSVALALVGILIKWGPQKPNEPAIVIFSLIGIVLVAFVYSYFFRCPKCKTNLNLSVIARIGNIHRCAKCGTDFKATEW